MIDDAAKVRILLIGAGRRIQNNFLPALKCLETRFQVRGIFSRTPERARRVAEVWGIPCLDVLEDDDLAGMDAVAISVPTSQNANVLKKLLPHAKRLHVVIDTPIAWTQEEFDAVTPMLAEFKGVTVTEDYMNFPQFKLVRETVRSGLIGELKNITLLNIGYLYHGLALLRSFVGFAHPVSCSRMVLNSTAVVTKFDFPGNLSGAIVGPYRRHNTGGIFIEGSKGIITEFPHDKINLETSLPVYTLSKYTEGGVEGFVIKGDCKTVRLETPEVTKMRSMDIADKSDLNLERGVGLMDVFMSIVDFRNVNFGYSFSQALFDSFASRRAQEGKTLLDPYLAFRSEVANFPQVKEKRTSRQSTYLKASTKSAAELNESQKIVIAPKDEIQFAIKGERERHLVVDQVIINGTSAPPGEWFLYPDHWGS